MAPVDPAQERGGGESSRLARFVRPYTLTAGRTEATVHLPLEATLQQASFNVDTDRMTTGARRVLVACHGRSVAEVASMTSMPVGVVRVLLSDLVSQGLVQVQETLTDSTPIHDRIALIERTLSALRAY